MRESHPDRAISTWAALIRYIEPVHASAVPRTIPGQTKNVHFTKSGSEMYREVMTQKSGVTMAPPLSQNENLKLEKPQGYL